MKTRISILIVLFITTLTYAQEKKWTLKECVEHALENNLRVKQNEYLVESSREDVVSAKGNFLPDLGASASSRINSGLSQDQDGVLKNTNNFTSSFNLSSSGVIFNGFRNLNTSKQAALGVESSKMDLQKMKDDISLNIINAYLNILFARENLNVANTQLEISNQQVEVTQAQFDAGVKPKGDLLNAQSTVATDSQNVVTLENTLDLALLNLAQLLQVSPEGFDVTDIDVGTPSASLLYDNANVVFEKAINNRPEIERAKLDVENSELAIQIAKGAYTPTLSYSLGVGTSYFHQFNNLLPNQSNSNFFQQFNDRFQKGVGLSLNIPIFNRLQTKASVNKAIINQKLSELELENQKLQLRQTIEQAYLDAKAAAKSFESARISLDAQNESFKNAQESYNLGAMTSFDFEQVRNRLVNAEATLIRAKYDYVFKTKVLKFYYGEPILD
jgi:outer membrane protein